MRKIGVLIVLLALAFSARGQGPYMVADFAEDDLPVLLDICHQGGFETLVVRTPFSTYGHYHWNETFAPEGDRSVRRMVASAAAEGVTLGLLVQEDAITLNDAFFAPKYFKEYQHSEPMVLFDEMSAEDVDIALRRNDLFKVLTSLNLLLIDDEVVSFGTMELTDDVVLLHRCIRGMYGTKRTAHAIDAKVFRIWDRPDPFVIPEGELRQSVHQQLNARLEAGNVTLMLPKGDPGQEMLEGSVRVRQVERWEKEGVANNTLGWFMIHASDRKRAATSMEELEWMLSKAAAFDASYGMLIDLQPAPGMLPEMLSTIRQWNMLSKSRAFTAYHKEVMSDPYLDWHLEQGPDSVFMLHPMNFSRRYPCAFQVADTGLLQSETWHWNADEEKDFGLRIQVDGEVAISNPMVNTSKGLVMFPCTISPGQRLLYDFGETANVVDANGNLLETVPMEGFPQLAQGENEASFLCEVDPTAEQMPLVWLRYITREAAFVIYP